MYIYIFYQLVCLNSCIYLHLFRALVFFLFSLYLFITLKVALNYIKFNNIIMISGVYMDIKNINNDIG